MVWEVDSLDIANVSGPWGRFKNTCSIDQRYMSMNQFIRKTSWGVADVFALIVSLFLGTWIMSPLIYPASSWLVLNSVSVSDATAGTEIKLRVNRDLLRGTEYGRYEVEVRSYPNNTQVCRAERSVPYVEGAYIEFDRDLSLDWWAYSSDGQCVNWKPKAGQYYVTTRHCWKGMWWAREACNPINKSNVFTVVE